MQDDGNLRAPSGASSAECISSSSDSAAAAAALLAVSVHAAAVSSSSLMWDRSSWMADPKWSSVSSSSSPSCAHSSGNALILFLLVDHVGEDGICTGSAIGKSMLCRTEYNYAAQARTGRSSAFDPA